MVIDDGDDEGIGRDRALPKREMEKRLYLTHSINVV